MANGGHPTLVENIKNKLGGYTSYSDFVIKNLDVITIMVIFSTILLYLTIIYFKY